MTTLPLYRGYQGSVEYDDGTLFIKILHIEDSVSTLCENASEVEVAFHKLVDDYIKTCQELGQEPNKAFRGSFNVRIEPSLHREAAVAAAEADCSLNAWVETAIVDALSRKRADVARLIDLARTLASQKPTTVAVWNSDLRQFTEFGPHADKIYIQKIHSDASLKQKYDA